MIPSRHQCFSPLVPVELHVSAFQYPDAFFQLVARVVIPRIGQQRDMEIRVVLPMVPAITRR